MSRIFRWLAFSPLMVNLAVLALVLSVVALVHSPNLLDAPNVIFAFLGLFSGYLVSKAIQFRYWQLHRPNPRSDAEVSAMVAGMMDEARAALSRDHGAPAFSGGGAQSQAAYPHFQSPLDHFFRSIRSLGAGVGIAVGVGVGSTIETILALHNITTVGIPPAEFASATGIVGLLLGERAENLVKRYRKKRELARRSAFIVYVARGALDATSYDRFRAETVILTIQRMIDGWRSGIIPDADFKRMLERTFIELPQSAKAGSLYEEFLGGYKGYKAFKRAQVQERRALRGSAPSVRGEE